MKRKPRQSAEAAMASKLARQFFNGIFWTIVKSGVAPQVISSVIQSEEIAISIDDMGKQGNLDSYLGMKWDQVAGIDIEYHPPGDFALHKFTLSVNGKSHDTFRHPIVNPKAEAN